jgi:plasmid stabilization system protein ParE
VKPFRFSDPASEEFTEAVRWYEQRRPGWGGKLFDAVTRTIERVQEHPEIGVQRSSRLPSRQLLVQGFPYKVVYRVREHDVYVVAVAHTSRRPGYWKDRR